MPAPKPSSLINRHETAEEKSEREERDASLRPNRTLPQNPPSSLRGRRTAEAVWRQLIRMYGELEAEIVTRLDMGLLVDFCLLAEQVSELDDMRKTAVTNYELLSRLQKKYIDEGKEESASFLANKITGSFEAILKIDGRVDRKRDLMFKLRQSLYLTPRARAGTAPKGKPPEEPVDPMDALLGKVNEFVNEKVE
jgi:phage terminase small subunit